MESEAAIGILALLIATGALLLAVFPGNRKRRLKVAGVAFAVAVIAVAMSPTPEQAAERKSAALAEKSIKDASDQKAALAEYRQELEISISIAESFSAKEFTKDAKSILSGAAILNSLASAYAKGKSLPLTDDDKKLHQRLKASAARRQSEGLPILRDAYGPAMRATLWEADGKARTFGNGYRTVEFINAAFAANRNIKKIHEDMYPTLMLLRFTRAQYKWVDANVEYQYYSLTPPKDEAVAIWNDNGTFTKID